MGMKAVCGVLAVLLWAVPAGAAPDGMDALTATSTGMPALTGTLTGSVPAEVPASALAPSGTVTGAPVEAKPAPASIAPVPDCEARAWSARKAYLGYCTAFGFAVGMGIGGDRLFETGAWGALAGAGIGALAGWLLVPSCP